MNHFTHNLNFNTTSPLVFQNHSPENSYSTQEIKEATQEVQQKIESHGDKNEEIRRKRGLSIEELSATESLIKSYDQSTKLIEIGENKTQIEGINISFSNLQEAIKTANLLNKLKHLDESYIMTGGSLDEVGIAWNTTIYSKETMQKHFPTLSANPQAFNNYVPLQPTGIKKLAQYDDDKMINDAIKNVIK